MEGLPLARTTPRPQPTTTRRLRPLARHGAPGGESMWAAYHHSRTRTTLTAVRRLTLQIRRGTTPACPQCAKPSRPKEEGRLALPNQECGLEVIALVGTLRDAQHRRVPEIHHELARRHVASAPRTVLHLLERDDARVTLSRTDTARLQRLTQAQGHVVLALEGLQPDGGHEVLWVVRDGLSTEVLVARSLLSATQADVTALLKTGRARLRVPIRGGISDGQHSIRCAVAAALPGVPHQRGPCHSRRAAATPMYEADRPAKKALKKSVRGVRPIERQLDSRAEPEAAGRRGDCSAVRSALTDDARPPLVASGLQLPNRLTALTQRLDSRGTRGPCPSLSRACTPSSSGASLLPPPCGPMGVWPTPGSIGSPRCWPTSHNVLATPSNVAAAAGAAH